LEAAGIFVAGILLGLSLAGPPGPVNAMIAVQSAAGSRFRGFLIGLGALTADATFLILTYYLEGLIAIDDRVRAVMYLASAVLLAYLAILTYRSRNSTKGVTEGVSKSAHIPYLAGLSVGITNPFQVTWWFSVGLSLIANVGILIIIGFFAGIFLWISVFPLAVSWAGRRLPCLYRIVVYISSAMLASFAGWFLYSSLALAISL